MNADEEKAERGWTCTYCGKVNPAGALACGKGEWDGCGAARPETLPVVKEQRPRPSSGMDRGAHPFGYVMTGTKPHSLPLGPTGVAFQELGAAVDDLKVQIGEAFLSDFRQAIARATRLVETGSFKGSVNAD